MTTNTLPTIPEYWSELNYSEQYRWIEENTDWHYHFDGINWSSGLWFDTEYNQINNGGGCFQCMAHAIEAFVTSWERRLQFGM